MAGRSLAKIEAAIAELVAAGQPQTSFTPLHLDVTDESTIKDAASTVEAQFGHLDVLINNAGISPKEGTLAGLYQATFATNVFGPVLVSNAFHSLLLKAENPKSIYVSSSVGSVEMLVDPNSSYHSTRNGPSWYRASKAALNLIAMHEQVEADERNLRLKIYAICPGFVISNLRGTGAERRNPNGMAQDPKTSAALILSILRGERENDRGHLLGRMENYPW